MKEEEKQKIDFEKYLKKESLEKELISTELLKKLFNDISKGNNFISSVTLTNLLMHYFGLKSYRDRDTNVYFFYFFF